NQHIEPMDMEHGSEKMKSPEKIEEKDADTQKEVKESCLCLRDLDTF
ncbi:hypothetical protein Tco_0338054, partial [Tanacetum coccineum]